MNLIDRVVHFRICDVYLPEPVAVLQELYGEQLLQGKVLDVTDSGQPDGSFVVVHVEGVAEPVIVPTRRVQVSFP